MPLYSCASANRATVKTVEFGFNSSNSLDGLSVVSVLPKTYKDASEYPLWAVETGEYPTWNLYALNPLWGIVAKEDPNLSNMSLILHG